MSDQGVTEIQLTGKQLAFFFMSAVVVLVVVFLFGVAVGRGVRSAVGETSAGVMTADGDLPTTEVPDDTAGATAEPELTYHDLLLGGDPAAAAAAAPTTAPPTPVSEPATPPASNPAPPSGDVWYLQTGAYSTKATADDQVTKLKALQMPAFVLEPAAGAPTKLFRVRIGPYTDRAEAEQVLSRLQRQGYEPSITR